MVADRESKASYRAGNWHLPGDCAGNQAHSRRSLQLLYWQYLNCFDLKVRSAFAYRQWTWLVELQVLFFWITAAILVVTGLRIWARSGLGAGCVFLAVSSVHMTAWRLAPAHTGIIILVIGMVTSLMYRHWRDVALLEASTRVYCFALTFCSARLRVAF